MKYHTTHNKNGKLPNLVTSRQNTYFYQALGAAKQAAQRPIHLEAGADLRRMGEELQKLDKAFLVLLICERIKSFLQGGGNLGELAFVSAFWREFAAAVILYLLEQTDPHHLYQ